MIGMAIARMHACFHHNLHYNSAEQYDIVLLKLQCCF